MRKILRGLFATVLLISLLVAFVVTRGEARYSIRPSRTKVHVREKGGEAFLTPEDVWKVLPLDIKEDKLMPIQTSELEKHLRNQIPYIDNVYAYVSPAGQMLSVNVESRTPILRYHGGGQSYFLDSNGKLMRTKVGASAYVPLAVGSVSDEVVQSVLYPLAQFLHSSKDWHYFFGLIEVQSPKVIHLYPRVGDYVFEITGVEHLEEDLDKINLFYKKIVPQVGANKYQLIKLSFKDQIVCTYR